MIEDSEHSCFQLKNDHEEKNRMKSFILPTNLRHSISIPSRLEWNNSCTQAPIDIMSVGTHEQMHTLQSLETSRTKMIWIYENQHTHGDLFWKIKGSRT